jgi:hypothetical protein
MNKVLTQVKALSGVGVVLFGGLSFYKYAIFNGKLGVNSSRFS